MLTLLTLSSAGAVLGMQRLQAGGQTTALILRTTTLPLPGTPASGLLFLRALLGRTLNRAGGSGLLGLAGCSLAGGSALSGLLLSGFPRAGRLLAVRLLPFGLLQGLLPLSLLAGRFLTSRTGLLTGTASQLLPLSLLTGRFLTSQARLLTSRAGLFAGALCLTLLFDALQLATLLRIEAQPAPDKTAQAAQLRQRMLLLHQVATGLGTLRGLLLHHGLQGQAALPIGVCAANLASALVLNARRGRRASQGRLPGKGQ